MDYAGSHGPKDVRVSLAASGTVARNIASTLNTPIGAAKEKASTMILRRNDAYAKKD